MRGLLPAAVLITMLIGCDLIDPSVRGSSETKTFTRDLAEFRGLDIRDGFDVEILQGQDFRIVFEVNENLEDFVQARVERQHLVIEMDSTRDFRNLNLKARITMPQLRSVKVSESSKVRWDHYIVSSPFDLEVLDGGGISGSISGSEVTANVEFGTLTLGGVGTDLWLEARHGSVVDLGELRLDDVIVDLFDSSQASIHLHGTLEGTLSGGSSITYFGAPTSIRLDATEDSKVTKGN